LKKRNTVVLYYSYTGHTAKLAETIAENADIDICEIKDQKRPGALKAFTIGCLKAMQMKPTPIESPEVDLTSYERIVILTPVWAGHPAPAALNAFDLLPSGKKVEVYMVSASGKSSAKAKIEALVAAKECELLKYENIAEK
jgi:flavodoxin